MQQKQVVHYKLKFQDTAVAEFNIKTGEVKPINWNYAPYSILNKPATFEVIKSWCSSRTLLTNREYCKEILLRCGIEDQSDLNICLISRALSFTDCYWISGLYGEESWSSINLFDNDFLADISITALTGIISNKTIKLDKNVYTGELSAKGIRAKCFVRDGQDIYIAKRETLKEMNAEEASYFINSLFDIKSAYYYRDTVYNESCIICKLPTGHNLSLISCRDVMNAAGVPTPDQVFDIFLNADEINFLSMCILDYICLNTDRNRDNYGFAGYGNRIYGLMPLYDHDSYFKGKGTNAIYFPTGKTFAATARYLKQQIRINGILYQKLRQFINSLDHNMEIRKHIINLIGITEYNSMVKRAKELLR